MAKIGQALNEAYVSIDRVQCILTRELDSGNRSVYISLLKYNGVKKLILRLSQSPEFHFLTLTLTRSYMYKRAVQNILFALKMH